MKFTAAVALTGAVAGVSGVALDIPGLTKGVGEIVKGLLPNGTTPLVPVKPLLDFPKVMPKTKEQIKKILDDAVPKPEFIHRQLERNDTRKPTPKGSQRRPEGSDFRLKAETTSSAAATSTTGADEPGATLQAWPCTNPRVRVEWRNLNDQQRDNYVGAIRCLMDRPSADPGLFQGSRNRYEDLSALHNQLTDVVHDVAAFLVWHRYFLGVFESLLRDECGYQDPLPWWDEARDAGNFGAAPMFNERWFGRLAPSDDGEYCVEQTGWGNFRPNVGGEDCLRRRLDDGNSWNCNQANVQDCIYNAQNYDGYRGCLEGWVHAFGHLAFNGRMANRYISPGDPAFYLHHAYMDRNWKIWQNLEWWNRVYEYGGPAPGGGSVSPDDMMTSFGIRPDLRVSDALDTEAATYCYIYDDQMGT